MPPTVAQIEGISTFSHCLLALLMFISLHFREDLLERGQSLPYANKVLL